MVAVNIQPILISKNGNIILNLSERKVMLSGDILHLTNTFNNILDNAIKYSDSEPIINVVVRSNNKNVSIRISDNGIGMDPKEFKRIFDKFYRISTGNIHDVKGFGLGLSYVKLIIENHGGKIYVESEKGKGSVFIIDPEGILLGSSNPALVSDHLIGKPFDFEILPGLAKPTRL